ncbi:MAG TPA: SufE family protein, partial [Pseudomonadales bacterium]|nr:SufE family protein [Pseudomonadales bacterium]
MNNPFGTEITSDMLVEDLGFFDDWEERYRYIIDLGKKIPPLTESAKVDSNLIQGCQSQVWIIHHYNNSANKLSFDVDSDAFIVKGLLAMIMAAYNDKTPAEILAFDVENYFNQTGLIKHLSPTRGNGLRSMVKRIR